MGLNFEDNVSNPILESMSIIVQDALDKSGFDKTVIAKITDDSQASKGIYQVLLGTSFFDVYSNDTSYTKGDSVYVLIPNNDIGKVKIIQGKANIATDEAYTAGSIFDEYINVTGNLIDTTLNSSRALTANSEEHRKLLWSYIGDSTILSNFTAVGISANFQTLLGENVIAGEYGLLLEITAKINNQSVSIPLYLSSKDMTGNPYNYSGFITQQKLFKIQPSEIAGVSLYFYQGEDSLVNLNSDKIFKDSSDNEINYKDDFGNILPSNLFVEDIELSFGYMSNEYTPGEDEAIIEIAPGYQNSFSKDNNEAVVNLRWVCWNNDKTKVLTQEEILEQQDFKIEWYYFRKKADVLADLESHRENYTFEFAHQTVENADLLLEDLKEQIGCSYINDENWQRLKDYDNLFSCKTLFDPESSNDYKIRAFIIKTNKNEEQVIQSNTIVFENAYYANLTKNGIKNGMFLKALDGSYGNYYCYTATGILNNEDAETRILKATYIDSEGNEVNLNNQEEYPHYEVIWDYPTESTMLNCYDGYNNNQDELIYYIKNIYDITATNNTVVCTIKKTAAENGEVSFFEAAYDFNFGQSGNIYGNNALKIDFYNLETTKDTIRSVYTRNAIEVGETEALFVIRMFNSSNEEIDLSDAKYSIDWELFVYDNDTGELKENGADNYVLSPRENLLLITKEQGFDFSEMLVLKASVLKEGEENTEAYTFYPIAISKDLINYNHIQGSSYIQYRLIGGQPIYSNEPYRIFTYNPRVKKINNENIRWDVIGSYDENATNNLIKLTEDFRLDPAGVYLKDAEIEQYGLACYDEEEQVWLQPLVILRVAFESATISRWDGKSVDINEDLGTIAAVMVAAGRKESDGSFTGVLMGDLVPDSNVPGDFNTGLYGFKSGEFTYGLKDDGTAFFGKNGNGQILIDGNHSWLTSNGYLTNSKGLFLDLDDAVIDAKNTKSNNEYNLTIDASDDNLGLNNHPFKIGLNNSPNFKVNWKGELFATGADVKGVIHADTLYLGEDEENWDDVYEGIEGEIKDVDDKLNENVERIDNDLYKVFNPSVKKYIKYKDLFYPDGLLTDSEEIFDYWIRKEKNDQDEYICVIYVENANDPTDMIKVEDNSITIPEGLANQILEGAFETVEVSQNEDDDDVVRYIKECIRTITIIEDGTRTYIDEYQNYIETNVGGGSFRISSKGLLKANNAVITGTVFATHGRIGGTVVLGTENDPNAKTAQGLLQDIIPDTQRYIKYRDIYLNEPLSYWVRTEKDENNHNIRVRYDWINGQMQKNTVDPIFDSTEKIYLSTGHEYKEYGENENGTDNKPLDWKEETHRYVKESERVVTTLNHVTTYVDEYDDYVETNVGGGTFVVSTNGLLRANNAVINGTVYATAGRIGGSVVIGSENQTADGLLQAIVPDIKRYTRYKDLLSTNEDQRLNYWVRDNKAYQWVSDENGDRMEEISSISIFSQQTLYLDDNNQYQTEVIANSQSTTNRYIKESDRIVTMLNGVTTYVDEYEDHIVTNVGGGNFAISTNGLLRANNAVISGAIYASAGRIGDRTKGLKINVTETAFNKTNAEWHILSNTNSFGVLSNFGQTDDGTLFATNANIEGAIHATSLSIGNEDWDDIKDDIYDEIEQVNNNIPSTDVIYTNVKPVVKTYISYKDLFPGGQTTNSEQMLTFGQTNQNYTYWLCKNDNKVYRMAKNFVLTDFTSAEEVNNPTIPNDLETAVVSITQNGTTENVKRYIKHCTRQITKIYDQYNYVDEYEKYIETNVGGGFFRISSNGLLKANNVVVTGGIYATTGNIGSAQTGAGIKINASQAAFDQTNTNTLWHLLSNNNNFGVLNTGKLYATGANIKGDIHATSLIIGDSSNGGNQDTWDNYYNGLNDNIDDLNDDIGSLNTQINGEDGSGGLNKKVNDLDTQVQGLSDQVDGINIPDVNYIIFQNVNQQVREYISYKDLYPGADNATPNWDTPEQIMNFNQSSTVTINGTTYNCSYWIGKSDGKLYRMIEPFNISNWSGIYEVTGVTLPNFSATVNVPQDNINPQPVNRYVKHCTRQVTLVSSYTDENNVERFNFTYVDEYEKYIETNVGSGNFRITKNGLLKATNAVISGTIYANAGDIGNSSTGIRINYTESTDIFNLGVNSKWHLLSSNGNKFGVLSTYANNATDKNGVLYAEGAVLKDLEIRDSDDNLKIDIGNDSGINFYDASGTNIIGSFKNSAITLGNEENYLYTLGLTPTGLKYVGNFQGIKTPVLDFDLVGELMDTTTIDSINLENNGSSQKIATVLGASSLISVEFEYLVEYVSNSSSTNEEDDSEDINNYKSVVINFENDDSNNFNIDYTTIEGIQTITCHNYFKKSLPLETITLNDGFSFIFEENSYFVIYAQIFIKRKDSLQETNVSIKNIVSTDRCIDLIPRYYFGDCDKTISNSVFSIGSNKKNELCFTRSGDLEITGNFKNGNGTLGEFIQGTLTKTMREKSKIKVAKRNTSVTNHNVRIAAYIELTEGTWILMGGGRFVSDAGGWRRINISSTKYSEALGDQRQAGDNDVVLQTANIVQVSADGQKYYLNCLQNGSTSTKVEFEKPWLKAVRIR